MIRCLRSVRTADAPGWTKPAFSVVVLALAALLGFIGPAPARQGFLADSDSGTAERAERVEAPDDWTPVIDVLGSGAGGLTGRLKAAFAVRFAGSWLDHSVTPSVLRVGVSRSVEGDEGVLDALAGRFADRLSVVSVRYSLDELNGFRTIVDEEVRRMGLEFGLGLNDAGNTVRVELPEDSPELRLAVVARGVPDESFEIRTGLVPVAPLHASRVTYPDYEGGLQLSIERPGEVGYGTCTSGFLARATNGSFYAMTAGHCGPNSSRVSIGTSYLSLLSANQYWGLAGTTDTDSVRFFVSSADSSARLMISSAPTHRLVKSPKYVAGDLVEGLQLCFLGATSFNNNCGTINFTGRVNPDGPGPDLDPAYCIDYPGLKGDSGGPVFSIRSDGSAKPAGIVHGRTPDGLSMCFTAVGRAEAALNVSLFYAS